MFIRMMYDNPQTFEKAAAKANQVFPGISNIGEDDEDGQFLQIKGVVRVIGDHAKKSIYVVATTRDGDSQTQFAPDIWYVSK